MPKMDGFKLAETLLLTKKYFEAGMIKDLGYRKRKAKKACPIIAVTAYQNVEIVERATKVGISQVLFKPVDVEVLRQTLERFY